MKCMEIGEFLIGFIFYQNRVSKQAETPSSRCVFLVMIYSKKTKTSKAMVSTTETSESFRSKGLFLVISHVNSRGVILIANRRCFASESKLY